MNYPRALQFLPLVAALIFATPLARSADADILAALKAKGAEPVETKGALTGLAFKDCTGLTEADYQQIHQLTHLKSLNFGKGFNDAGLKALGTMPDLESLVTNGMDLTDEGVGVLANFPNLHTFALFHPGKGFTGTGLAALAKLRLERLTVGGSLEFGDAAMAAVASLGTLKEFRTWHTGVTIDGIKKLPALKGLTSLTLGQRLAHTPPTMLSDEALPVLADCSSLETLNLQEARLTLGALGQLKKLSKLKHLNLDGIDIPESDVAALKSQFTGVDVRWKAPDDVTKKRIGELFGAK